MLVYSIIVVKGDKNQNRILNNVSIQTFSRSVLNKSQGTHKRKHIVRSPKAKADVAV